MVSSIIFLLNAAFSYYSLHYSQRGGPPDTKESCCCDMLPIFRLMSHVSVVVLVGVPYRHGVMVDGVTSRFNKIKLMFLTAIVLSLHYGVSDSGHLRENLTLLHNQITLPPDIKSIYETANQTMQWALTLDRLRIKGCFFFSPSTLTTVRIHESPDQQKRATCTLRHTRGY